MERRQLTYSLVYGLTVLLLAQCQKKAAPSAPRAEGFDPPIPATRSYVSTKITFRLSELQAKINEELGPVLVGNGVSKGAGKKPKNSLIPFSVVRSGPVRIQYSNGQVRFSAPLQVQLPKLGSSTKPEAVENPFCAIDVNFMSPLSLTPAWRLSSKVKFTGYEWTVKPQIRLLGMNISLEKFAQQVLEKHQSTIETAIDSAVYKKLRLDKIVQPIWKNIHKPLLLSKQYGLWLLPKPISVTASSISGDDSTITTPVRIAFNTETQLNPNKPEPTVTALPPLQKREQIPPQSDLSLLSFIPYKDINRTLARLLTGENKKLLKGTLVVNSASVYGAQQSLIIKTEVRGVVNQTLYFQGRPRFDAQTRTLRIDNVDFTTETKDVLSKASGEMVHDALCNLLETMLRISLAEDINRLPQKIDAAFEKSKGGKKTDLYIQSFKFLPQKIAIRPDGIQTLIKVESVVGLKVQHL